jgi:hypothetical protein
MGFAIRVKMCAHAVAMVRHVAVFVNVKPMFGVFLETHQVDINGHCTSRAIFRKIDQAPDFLPVKHSNSAIHYEYILPYQNKIGLYRFCAKLIDRKIE